MENFIGIYVWINKITSKIYIGSSTDLIRRLKSHFLGQRSNKLLQEDIKQYGIENFTVSILEFIPYNQDIDKLKKLIISREQYYLDKFCGAKDSNKIFDELSYNLMKEANCPIGNYHSDGTKKKLSNIKKGRKLTPEWKEKISKNHASKQEGYIHHTKLKGLTSKDKAGLVVMQEKNKKVILQYCAFSGEFKKEWSSLVEAADSLGIHPSNISKNLNKHTKTCCKSIFLFKEGEIEQFITTKGKRIAVYDLDLKLLGVFNNSYHIEKELGINHSVVNRNLKKSNNTGIGKYNIFKYVD